MLISKFSILLLTWMNSVLPTAVLFSFHSESLPHTTCLLSPGMLLQYLRPQQYHQSSPYRVEVSVILCPLLKPLINQSIKMVNKSEETSLCLPPVLISNYSPTAIRDSLILRYILWKLLVTRRNLGGMEYCLVCLPVPATKIVSWLSQMPSPEWWTTQTIRCSNIIFIAHTSPWYFCWPKTTVIYFQHTP